MFPMNNWLETCAKYLSKNLVINSMYAHAHGSIIGT